MSPLGSWNLQWLNHNAQRSYPLTERASKTDTTGTLTLPDSFIVGLYFPVSTEAVVDPAGFFIKNVLISPTGFNITIGYASAGTIVDVAAANIIRSNYTPNRSYALGGIDQFDDCVGNIVLGPLDDIDQAPPGLYTFTPAAGELEPDAIRPMIRSVSRLQVSNNGELSDYIYGQVTLVAGANVRIDVNTVGDVTEIVFNAISGLNLNNDCLCDVPPVAPCIKCINGVCSDDGNFYLSSNECVEIASTANGLSIKDTCCTPCCGCKELDAIALKLQQFNDGVATLQNFVSRLGAEVTQMNLVVIGSRTADCTTCQPE